MSKKALVSAKEVTRMLGIKPATLYAYVSRGLVRTAPDADGRSKLYVLADVEKLKARQKARAGHGAVAASAMRWGEPILDSAISFPSEGDLFLRGCSLKRLLAADTPFESVCELLWSGQLPQKTPAWTRDPATFPLPASLPDDGAWTWTARFSVVLATHALHAGHASSPTLDGTLERARFLIRLAAATVDPARCLPELKNASTVASLLALAAKRDPDDDAVRRALDSCLVAAADHELNASTFAARVVASTDAELPACILAALGALSGLRHGATVVAVGDLLARLDAPSDARNVCKQLIAAGKSVPGFGHQLYPGGDPRCEALLAASHAVKTNAMGKGVVAKIDALVEAMQKLGGEPPTIDLGLVATAAAVGLSPAGGALALFGVGRMAGWVAHVVEQRQQGYLLRPRAHYVGRPPEC